MKFAWINDGNGNGPVTGLNRAGNINDGEETGIITPQNLVHGMDHNAYEIVAGVFTPFGQEDMVDLELGYARTTAINDVKNYCKDWIIKAYPLEVQSSMSLGVYPEAVVITGVNFIADCIEEENRVNALFIAATSLQDIEDAIATISWPVSPV